MGSHNLATNPVRDVSQWTAEKGQFYNQAMVTPDNLRMCNEFGAAQQDQPHDAFSAVLLEPGQHHEDMIACDGNPDYYRIKVSEITTLSVRVVVTPPWRHMDSAIGSMQFNRANLKARIVLKTVDSNTIKV